jgi:hypothetical protein
LTPAERLEIVFELSNFSMELKHAARGNRRVRRRGSTARKR